jgi:hypothetical protein
MNTVILGATDREKRVSFFTKQMPRYEVLIVEH